MAGLPSNVAGCAFGDQDTEATLLGMSLVSEEAQPVPVLTPMRRLQLPFLFPLRHRFYGREAWRTGNTTSAGWKCRVVSGHGFMDHSAETMLSSMSLVSSFLCGSSGGCFFSDSGIDSMVEKLGAQAIQNHHHKAGWPG